VGIATNLIVFPASFVILQLFRRSRPRSSRSQSQLDSIMSRIRNKSTKPLISSELNSSNSSNRMMSDSEKNADFISPRRRLRQPQREEKNKKEKRNKSMQLPWWGKLVGYALSLLVSITSLFFVVVKGIEFGNEKVAKWLSSVVASFLASMLLTQPLQLTLVSFFFVVLCRKTRQMTSLTKELNEDRLEEAFSDVSHQQLFIVCIFLSSFFCLILYRCSISNNDDQNKAIAKNGLSSINNQNSNPQKNRVSMSQIDDDLLKQLRKSRMNEKRVSKLLRELLLYGLFICALGIVAYTNGDANLYPYQERLKSLLIKAINENSTEFNKASAT
jgi:hypothetical protein